MEFTTTEWICNAENDECGNEYYYTINQNKILPLPYRLRQYKNNQVSKINVANTATFEECVKIAQNWDSEIIRIQHE